MTDKPHKLKNVEPILVSELHSSSVALYIPASVVPYFKELIRKGGNCWLKAPVEIKEFVSQFGHELPADDHYRNHAVYKSAEQLNEELQGASERA